MMQLREPGEVCIGSELVLWKSDCRCGRHKNYRQLCWLFRLVSAKASTERYISFLGNDKATDFHNAPPKLALDWTARGIRPEGCLTDKQYLNLAKTYLEQHPIKNVELNEYDFEGESPDWVSEGGLYPLVYIPQGKSIKGKRLTQRERDLVSVEIWQKEQYWQPSTNMYSSSELSVLMTKSGQVMDAAKIEWLRHKHLSKGKDK